MCSHLCHESHRWLSTQKCNRFSFYHNKDTALFRLQGYFTQPLKHFQQKYKNFLPSFFIELFGSKGHLLKEKTATPRLQRAKRTIYFNQLMSMQKPPPLTRRKNCWHTDRIMSSHRPRP